MCFHKGPLVLHYALVMWMLYFSHFFTSFFIGLCRICLCAKLRINLVFIICSLLAVILLIVWLINIEIYIFLNEKDTSVLRTLKITFYGFEVSKFSRAELAQTPSSPHLRKEDYRLGLVDTVGYSILYSRLLYSIQSVTLFETPVKRCL